MSRSLQMLTRGPLCAGGKFFVAYLCQRERLGFPKDVAYALWAMISASQDEEAQAFIFETSHLLRILKGPDPKAGMATVEKYFQEWLTPDLVTQAIGELITRDELDEATGHRLQMRLDEWTDDKGDWRW